MGSEEELGICWHHYHHPQMLARAAEVLTAPVAAISTLDMTASFACDRHHIQWRSEGCTGTRVVVCSNPDCVLALGRSRLHDGHPGVVGDRASCAVHRCKRLLSRSGHTSCMVSELLGSNC